MTSGVSLNSIAPVSSFSISSHFHTLFSKVDRVFGLYLTVVTSLCLYHASRCYQFIMNPSFQLDDRLKAVKCKMILKSIQDCLKDVQPNNKSFRSDENLASLVQECEALHNSMTKKDPIISKGLFEYYSKKNPEQAYQIAQRFSSEKELFSACQAIHKASPEFDREKLSSLLNKAYEARTIQENRISEVRSLLEYAKLANSLDKNSALKDTTLLQAINLAGECGEGLDQVDACCDVDKVCKDLENNENIFETNKFKSFLRVITAKSDDVVRSYLDSTKEIPEDASQLEADFKVHLALAKASLLCKENKGVMVGLERAGTLLYQGILQDFDVLASVYKEAGDSLAAQKIFEHVYTTLNDKVPNVDDAALYLRLASAYQKHDEQDGANMAFASAIGVIEKLPESTDKEIHSKLGLFEQVSCCEAMHEELALQALKSFEQLYSKCSFGEFTKKRITLSIFEFCKAKQLKEHSEQFFESYFTGLTNSKLRAFDKINEFATFSTEFSLDQRTRMLEAAEGFVSQVDSCEYVLSKTIIAEGYIGVSTAKSQELLDNYAKGQAWEHLWQSAIPPVALAIFHAYPMIGLFCSAALPLIWQLRVHRF